MANYQGGSAPAMASQIAEGFILLTANTLKGYLPGELANLRQEVDKLLREVRSTTPASDDALAQQSRNRKIARLSGAIQIVQARMTARH
ncbi:MAG TPA: hypothetical protein VI669_04580 [Vicinamibacteria bacterium]